MILPRIITAVVGIPVMLIVIYFGSIPFLLFILFIVVASNYEYYIMMRTSFKHVDPFSLFISAFIFPLSFYLTSFPDAKSNFVFIILGLVVILPFFKEIFASERMLERIAYTYIGIFFISFTLSHLILLREIPYNGRSLVYILFISVWICDTAAYFIGKGFGKHQLSPVSPKKTVEGFFAGLFSTILFYYLISKKYEFLSGWGFLALAFVVGLAAQYSDLAQSLIKRACGVKDSSNLLPGHGGVFDRFDSYLFLSPLFYYFYILLAT